MKQGCRDSTEWEESWADQDQDQDQEAANKFVYVLPRLVPDIGGNPRASSPHLASHLTSRGGSDISWSTNSEKKKEGSLQTKSPVCYSFVDKHSNFRVKDCV